MKLEKKFAVDESSLIGHTEITYWQTTINKKAIKAPIDNHGYHIWRKT